MKIKKSRKIFKEERSSENGGKILIKMRKTQKKLNWVKRLKKI